MDIEEIYSCIDDKERNLKMKTIIALAINCIAVSLWTLVAYADAPMSRIDDLDGICACVPSDNLDAAGEEPTPDQILVSYNITTNVLVQDLKAVAARHGLMETNVYGRLARTSAIGWLGTYGGTNDLEYLRVVVTNQCDYAQQSAIGASMSILKHSPKLIEFVRDVVTNSTMYSASIRTWTSGCILGMCTEGESDNYICDPAQHLRIAAFFLERAAVEQDDVLFIDRCAYTLNPSYRHSQQRRNNLAALRPPGLTGRRAELYDAAQRDAAQGD